VAEGIDHDRRRFLATAATTLTVSRAGFGQSRELAAIGGAAEWLNSKRLTAAGLLGKVVLVNFCTYTCINWLRQLPYVRAWAQRYRHGFVLIGVHTPEFAFEKELDNVRPAIQKLRIAYPIVIDNDYSIWRAFRNNYWPALYFIDLRGRVREHHFGEGEYERSERAIQRLLTEAGLAGVPEGVVSAEGDGIEAQADWGNLRSPENYLGQERTQNFSTSPARLSLNQWALVGEWANGRLAITSKAPQARIVNRFHARDLHLVMGPTRRDRAVRFRVTIDGQPPAVARGLDVDESGNGTVAEQRLYQLIRQPSPIVDRTFAIEFLDAGVEAFAFTFG
jgi:Thioredoxin like C-terminal domain/AhpC/TSA family